jgi:phosphatidylserine/phosphatidylglycerophosphate/cardiolipin synthase-like enzyme
MTDRAWFSVPVLSGLTYDSITQTGVTLFWITDAPADSKVWWMVSDSNYQPLVFTDSLIVLDAVTDHVVSLTGLQPGTIYRYCITSANNDGTASDTGYFITQSNSSGSMEAYFNHTVDTTVNAGEKANGDQNFEDLLIDRIGHASHSIDITLWEFANLTAIADELVKATKRGVKIRFIYNHAPNTPLIDTLLAHGIPVLKREYDTTYDMHNKFWIFDYRNNFDPGTCYLNTGSANVSHPMFHSDRNNMIVIQDKSLCAVYTREFEQMWGSHGDLPDTIRSRFGTHKIDNVPHLLNVAGTRMEVWFCPIGNVASKYCNLFHANATKSVFFCMFKFYLTDIEDTLHTLFNRGMGISGVFDSSHALRKESVYLLMKGKADSGAWNPPADVFFDPVDGLLHHKYCIIDADAEAGNKITVTGSFNWDPETNAGNDDNALVIFSPRINNLYFQEFMARYRESGGSLIGMAESEHQGFDGMLEQNYPNPASGTTKIRYHIPEAGRVRLQVFDLHGIQLVLLLDKTETAGTHEVTWDAAGFPAGVYYYMLTTANFCQTREMVIIR